MVVLAIEGYIAPAIARSLSSSRRVCQRWGQRYNAEGLEGLQDKPGRGKPPLLIPEEKERFKQRIDAGPTAEDTLAMVKELARHTDVRQTMKYAHVGIEDQAKAPKGGRG